MQVDVSTHDLETVRLRGSITQVTGTNSEDPTQRVTFAGDTRMIEHFIDLVYSDGVATANVDPWAVIAIFPVEAP